MLESVCTSMHSGLTFSFSRFKMANLTRVTIPPSVHLFIYIKLLTNGLWPEKGARGLTGEGWGRRGGGNNLNND